MNIMNIFCRSSMSIIMAISLYCHVSYAGEELAIKEHVTTGIQDAVETFGKGLKRVLGNPLLICLLLPAILAAGTGNPTPSLDVISTNNLSLGNLGIDGNYWSTDKVSLQVLPNGNIFVAREENYALMGRIFSSEGQAIGEEFTINLLNDADLYGSVASFSSNDGAVFWENEEYTYYGQRFRPDGHLIGDPWKVKLIDGKFEDSLAWNITGDFCEK